jgi:hypothetical protein
VSEFGGSSVRCRPGSNRHPHRNFKRPWDESHRYDRVSGEGYYRDALDFEAIDRLLLQPARHDGSGAVALCTVDPIRLIKAITW